MRRRVYPRVLAAMIASGGLVFGLFGSCNDTLIAATEYFDPCGTILNCQPGYFQTINAGVGDWTIDPTCPIPGDPSCNGGTAYSPLGTIYDLDP
ncbi:MAG: hypothetical protein KJ749_11745 [Planctomycetes bacterium]|nr:hypothetical protein [Planctomycetota bacterium]